MTNTIYHVTLDGVLLSSFPTQLGADSSVAVDSLTDTLWSVAENAGGGRIVNFSKAGELPPGCGICEPLFGAATFGAVEPEGVGVDPSDDSLWIVDDPSDPNLGFVYHVERDGTPIASFATSIFDPASKSPQAVAIDPFDGSLWVTDNSSNTIYNVTKTGSLIASISVLVYTSVFDPGVTNPNPQGISIDASDGSLWVTDRETGRIYHIASGRSGEAAGDLISSFESSSYDGSSQDPTGIAYDRPAVSHAVPALSGWGLLALAAALVAAGPRAAASLGRAGRSIGSLSNEVKRRRSRPFLPRAS